MSMLCPKCGSRAVVLDTRPADETTTRRTYECRKCKRRWVTREMIVIQPTRRLSTGGAGVRGMQDVSRALASTILPNLSTDELVRELIRRAAALP